MWCVWAKISEKPDKQIEDVARLWREKLPGDPQPLVLLSGLAEKRKALTLATKYLGEAEAIDPMNPHVREGAPAADVGHGLATHARPEAAPAGKGPGRS